MTAKRFSSTTWLAGLVVALVMFTVSAGAVESFRFVQISDLHVSSPDSIAALKLLVDDINALQPPVDFVLVSGDLTDQGSETEFQDYATVMAALAVPVYNVPGNHDARWSAQGKLGFSRLFGPPYRAFDHKGLHLMLLDSAMELEQYGHFDVTQLNWLREDAKKVPDGEPILMMCHHPPFDPQHFIDNEDALLAAVEGKNVVLFLAGHIHLNKHYEFNGIPIVTALAGKDLAAKDAAASSYSYYIFNVKADGIEVYRRYPLHKELRLDFTLPIARQPVLPLHFTRPGDSQPEGRPLAVSVKGADYSGARIEVDNKPDLPLDSDRGTFSGTIPSASLEPGRHLLRTTAVTADGKYTLDTKPVSIAAPRRWLLADIELGGDLQAAPEVEGRTAYLGCGDDNLYAVRVPTGQVSWKFNTGAPIHSSPVVAGDKVLIGNDEGDLFAVRSSDGQPVWKFTTGGAIYSSPREASDTVYFGSGDGNVYAVQASTGNELWHFQTGKLVKARPAYANGKLYFGSWDMNFYCVRADTGQLVWKEQVTDNPYFPAATSNPAVEDGKVVVASHDHTVHCWEAETGKVLWKQPTQPWREPGYSSPVISKGVVYLGSLSGHAVALRLDTGAELWHTQLGDPADPVFDSGPLLSNNLLWMGSVGGKVYAVAADTGKLVHSYAFYPGYIFASPAAAEGMVLIASVNGHLYGIRSE